MRPSEFTENETKWVREFLSPKRNSTESHVFEDTSLYLRGVPCSRSGGNHGKSVLEGRRTMQSRVSVSRIKQRYRS